MAWLFLQENVQVQYLQKIALRAENKLGPRMGIDQLYFLQSNFLLPLRQHIFRQVARLLMPVPLPFSPSFISHICLPNGNGNCTENCHTARVVLPSRQIHLDESDDEEDDHTDQKADAYVFIEFGVSLLPGVNLIEAVEDEVNCQEHTENQGCLTNYASGICPYLVDKIHGAKENKK